MTRRRRVIGRKHVLNGVLGSDFELRVLSQCFEIPAGSKSVIVFWNSTRRPKVGCCPWFGQAPARGKA